MAVYQQQLQQQLQELIGLLNKGHQVIEVVRWYIDGKKWQQCIGQSEQYAGKMAPEAAAVVQMLTDAKRPAAQWSVLQQSFLRDPARDPSALALGGPEGFRFAEDGGAEVLAASETKRMPVTRPDGGAGTVELGQRERR